MQCSNPFLRDGLAFGCGQCLPCRINKRREWMHRIVLESTLHSDNAFVTLTYSDEFLPDNGSLEPRHLQLFLKRLRKKFEPHKLRFFAVGEYGEITERPHYHAALFGYPTCKEGSTRRNRNGAIVCCDICRGVQSVWGSGDKPMGNIHLGSITPESAAYVCGYVTKKLTKEGDERLEGRKPEFARMSLRPGIGADIMDDVASTILEHKLDEKLDDVPNTLRHGSRILPLGRYLKNRLRERIGREKKAPEKIIEQAKEKLRPLREAAKTIAPTGSKEWLFKSLIIDSGEGKRIQAAARHREKERKKTL